jgi:hypothetical protein
MPLKRGLKLRMRLLDTAASFCSPAFAAHQRLRRKIFLSGLLLVYLTPRPKQPKISTPHYGKPPSGGIH